MEASKLAAQRTSLIGYMRIKIDAEDWHAVADAAMDLREIDAKLSLLKEAQWAPDAQLSSSKS